MPRGRRHGDAQVPVLPAATRRTAPEASSRKAAADDVRRPRSWWRPSAARSRPTTLRFGADDFYLIADLPGNAAAAAGCADGGCLGCHRHKDDRAPHSRGGLGSSCPSKRINWLRRFMSPPLPRHRTRIVTSSACIALCRQRSLKEAILAGCRGHPVRCRPQTLRRLLLDQRRAAGGVRVAGGVATVVGGTIGVAPSGRSPRMLRRHRVKLSATFVPQTDRWDQGSPRVPANRSRRHAHK